ncbi:hypothetical protein [Xanthomonas sp. NCPPB 2632]|uniref:hypothetical protein n=1 Tax=Xanthomonas sp. NCPPB 2632 TaxID=3240912 RepID=UPI0035112CEF
METDYKPTLRFDVLETRRINAAARKAELRPSEWMRKLIMNNAPELTLADPLAVRVDGFDEKCGWSLIHYSDALAHFESVRGREIGTIAAYLKNYLTVQEGEAWIDGDKLPGVSPSNVTSIEAQAVDLCRAINIAHIRSELAK